MTCISSCQLAPGQHPFLPLSDSALLRPCVKKWLSCWPRFQIFHRENQGKEVSRSFSALFLPPPSPRPPEVVIPFPPLFCHLVFKSSYLVLYVLPQVLLQSYLYDPETSSPVPGFQSWIYKIWLQSGPKFIASDTLSQYQTGSSSANCLFLNS